MKLSFTRSEAVWAVVNQVRAPSLEWLQSFLKSYTWFLLVQRILNSFRSKDQLCQDCTGKDGPLFMVVPLTVQHITAMLPKDIPSSLPLSLSMHGFSVTVSKVKKTE